MTWMNGLRATFDLETTGVDVTTARIVTASLILLDPQGNVVRRGEWLAHPGGGIPARARACAFRICGYCQFNCVGGYTCKGGRTDKSQH